MNGRAAAGAVGKVISLAGSLALAGLEAIAALSELRGRRFLRGPGCETSHICLPVPRD